jgi:hypothetical protein
LSFDKAATAAENIISIPLVPPPAVEEALLKANIVKYVGRGCMKPTGVMMKT